MPALPTGTVTFLFTDMEGSTRLWEAYPDAMRKALVRHDAVLRQAIEYNNGVVFKTVGDAFCAAFATAPDALSAALAAQCALHTEPSIQQRFLHFQATSEISRNLIVKPHQIRPNLAENYAFVHPIRSLFFEIETRPIVWRVFGHPKSSIQTLNHQSAMLWPKSEVIVAVPLHGDAAGT